MPLRTTGILKETIHVSSSCRWPLFENFAIFMHVLTIDTITTEYQHAHCHWSTHCTPTALPRISDILWGHGFILFCICRLSLGNTFAHRIKWNVSNGTSFKIYTLPPHNKCTVSLIKTRFWQAKSILYMADEQVYVVGTFFFMVNLDKLVPRLWHVEIQRIYCKTTENGNNAGPVLISNGGTCHLAKFVHRSESFC